MGERESSSADSTHWWHAFLGRIFSTGGQEDFPNPGPETSATMPEAEDAPNGTTDPFENQLRLSLSAYPMKCSVRLE